MADDPRLIITDLYEQHRLAVDAAHKADKKTRSEKWAERSRELAAKHQPMSFFRPAQERDR